MNNTALPEPVAQAVMRAFELEYLGSGNQPSKNHSSRLIDSIWIIEFPHYFYADIYIAGVNQVKWIPHEDETFRAINVYKGLLLAAPFAKFEFYGTNPYRVIDLEWPDAMTKGLQSLNMLPHWASIPQLDGSYQAYKVHTYWSGGGEGHALYKNITHPTSEMEAFHKTILRTIVKMAAVYDDPEINQIIKQGCLPFPLR
jgi:hypothetical protein